MSNIVSRFTHPAVATARPPVLFDRVVFRFVEPVDLPLQEDDANGATGAELIAALKELAADGLCDEPPEWPSPQSLPVTVRASVGVPSGGTVAVGGRLVFKVFSRPGGWHIAANSRLTLNGMDFLRSRLPDAGALGLALDGGTNWVGPADATWDELQRTQVDGLAFALDAWWSDFRARLPGGAQLADPLLALRDVELCRDVARRDAIATALALHGTWPDGMRHLVTTFYAADQGNVLASDGAGVRWSSRPQEPPLALKAYAKRVDLLRLEAVASKGVGVKRLLGLAPKERVHPVALAHSALGGLLTRVARGGSVHLDTLSQHVVAMDDPPAAGEELLFALGPLLAVASDGAAPRPGAPISGATRLLARATVRDLLRLGVTRPRTPSGRVVPKSSPVREALDGMVRTGVLRFRRGYRCDFVLRPRFTTARRSLAPIVLPLLPEACAPALAAE